MFRLIGSISLIILVLSSAIFVILPARQQIQTQKELPPPVEPGSGTYLSFIETDRYFPNLVDQKEIPLFFWNNFLNFDRRVWGDNQDGNIQTNKINDHEGVLHLVPNQMIWLVYRLIPGTLEFRWLKVEDGNQNTTKPIDKYWGFGDPSEGFAAGFRFQGESNSPQLYAETINMGQRYATPINFDPLKTNTRYYIEWSSNEIRYSLATAEKFQIVATHKNENLPEVGLPKVLMEISIQNLSGDSNILLPLVKYDARLN